MEAWQALVLGLVEGITEYLPVSSTGHLLVTQRLLGIEPSKASNAFAITMQAGAIAAVLGLYRARVSQAALGLVGRSREGARLLLALGIAFVPAGLLGLASDEWLEEHLFGPWPIVAAWTVGGVVLLVLGRRLVGRKGLPVEAIGYRTALLVGLAQCAALWPGVSRSLATILGGLAAGLSMPAAVEFSFLLGVVTLGMATAYKALQSGAQMVQQFGPVPIAIAFVTAWLSAVLAVKWMVGWLNRRGMALFGYWRIVAALSVGTLVLVGVL
jgi:undecaprenyl-diphosphatase